MEFNYATIEIEKVNDDVIVGIAVKNYHNQDVLTKTLSLKKDLTYNESKTLFNKMCQVAHAVNHRILMINKLLKSTIVDKNLSFMNDVYILIVTIVMLLPLTFVIWVFSILSKYFSNKSKIESP